MPCRSFSYFCRTAKTITLVIAAVLIGLLLTIGISRADELGRTKINLKNPKTDNFILFADEVTRAENGTIIATGNVQIISEPYILTADKVSYAAEQDMMTAQGNVRIMHQPLPGEAPTEVLFTDYLETSGEITADQMINIKTIFSDNSRLVARDGKRFMNDKDMELTEMHDVVYSPCNLCKSNPEHAPLWQLKADRFVHDTDAQEMRYYDATLEFYGIPVLYTPYFAHGDPSTEQEAGLLPPEYLSTNYLGAFIRNYYYYPFSQDKDATLELSESTRQGPVAGFEYRQRFDKAKLEIRGAGTDSDLQTQTGRRQTTRGYLAAKGLWDITPKWRAGADLEYTGDKTFLRQYKYDDTDVLTNRLYAERFEGRSYGVVNAYGFQDLRPNKTGDQPNLLPAASYSNFGKPGAVWGGRWAFNTSFIGITRPYGGQSVQRLSADANWERQWISNTGLKSTLTLGTRGDNYQVQGARKETAGQARAGDNYAVNRYLLSGDFKTSLPFIKNGENFQYTLEPTASISATSRIKNSAVPNEDSQDIELDSSNLFSQSRFPGLDRIEDGERATYGLRGSVNPNSGGYYSVFGGQSLRLAGSSKLPASSGLLKDSSDLVAEVNAMPGQWLDLDYHFRADQDTLAAQRHEATISGGPAWLRASSSYAFLKEVPGSAKDLSHNQITNTISAKLDDRWTLFVLDKKDLDRQPKSLITDVGIKYLDECFTITASFERNYTQRIGLSTGDSFYLSIGFKNLGTYGSQPFNSLSHIPLTTVVVHGASASNVSPESPHSSPLEADVANVNSMQPDVTPLNEYKIQNNSSDFLRTE